MDTRERRRFALTTPGPKSSMTSLRLCPTSPTRSRRTSSTAPFTPIAEMTEAFVYVLGSARNADRRTYVGWCVDLNQRLAAHNSGKGARSTRGRTWVLLYAERYAT